MKRVFAILVILTAVSCSSKVDNPGTTTDDIKQQISEYKNEVLELNKKIAELEQTLKSTQTEEEYKVAVTTQKLAYEPFNHYVQVGGTVEAVNLAEISPETNGQVKKIYVAEGERVQKGQTLVRLNTSVTEGAIKELETRLELAETLYERQKKLWDKQIGSEIDYLTARNNKESLESNLETVKAQLELSVIKAPFGGIVDDIFVKEGELAVPGFRIMTLVNLDELYINADASEAYITKIKKGDMVKVEFPSYPEIKEELPVHRVGNVVKPANRTFNIQVKMSNPDNQIKPNVISTININDFTEENALTVPSIIIKKDLIGEYLYVARNRDNKRIAEKKYIGTGLAYENKTLVTSGLEPGDEVIIDGYNMVSDGIAVEIAGN